MAAQEALAKLVEWMVTVQMRRFLNDAELAAGLRPPKSRENYFFNQEGENLNPAPVVFEPVVPITSVGWTRPEFFANLGDERKRLASLEREAEQEYLLQGMVKDAMWEAAEIAQTHRVGIAVRPTGVLAHMGIESGDPTKAQEFKNKTSKDVDLYLCDELRWEDVGAVVHYDPRLGWTSRAADIAALSGLAPMSMAPTEAQWTRKRSHIETTRLPALKPLITAKRIKPPDWAAVKETFFSRANEYREEDHQYRLGHYAPHTKLVGPLVRLKVRQGSNMYGDHDIFGFTTPGYGQLKLDTDLALRRVQIALQQSNAFQAQHGGIWNWKPTADFNVGIKTKIMGAHSAPKGSPLIYIQPGHKVHAVFYVPGREVLESVWDHPTAENWLEETFSGKAVIERPVNEATSDVVAWLENLRR